MINQRTGMAGGPNLKARFEKIIEWSPRAAELAHKADTTWSDILWTFRGDDDLVDDEFLRYFEFVTEICGWSDEKLDSGGGSTLIQRATDVFGAENPNRVENLDFLFTAFDVWSNRDVRATFEEFFRAQGAPTDATLPLFFRDPNVNLFESCCRAYGVSTGGGNRNFTFGQTLLLLAVVLHLAPGGTDEFAIRLRTLRNLIEGSQFELRADRMPRLVADARQLILTGELPQPGGTFSVAQYMGGAVPRCCVDMRVRDSASVSVVINSFAIEPQPRRPTGGGHRRVPR
jgi:hypothetical protein